MSMLEQPNHQIAANQVQECQTEHFDNNGSKQNRKTLIDASTLDLRVFEFAAATFSEVVFHLSKNCILLRESPFPL